MVAHQKNGLFRLHYDLYYRKSLFRISQQVVIFEFDHLGLNDLISHFNKLVEGFCERKLLNGPSVALSWCSFLKGEVVPHQDKAGVASADFFRYKTNPAFRVSL